MEEPSCEVAEAAVLGFWMKSKYTTSSQTRSNNEETITDESVISEYRLQKEVTSSTTADLSVLPPLKDKSISTASWAIGLRRLGETGAERSTTIAPLQIG